MEINKNSEVYSILEEERFRLEPAQIDNRWRVYKQPKDTYALINERIEQINQEKNKYEE